MVEVSCTVPGTKVHGDRGSPPENGSEAAAPSEAATRTRDDFLDGPRLSLTERLLFGGLGVLGAK